MGATGITMRYEFNYSEVERLRFVKGLSWGKLGRMAKFPSTNTIYTVRDQRASRSTMKAVAKALRVPIETLIVEVTDEAKETA